MSEIRPVRVRQLIKEKRLSPMSPPALIAEKLGIKWFMLFNDEYVYGPTPGIVEAADLLLAEFKPKTVIDLFGGSGALSKLAVIRGAENVVYVDFHPEAAARNLKNQKKVKIIEADALEFLENPVSCDILIADPPEELIDELLRKLPRIREISQKAALIWIGPSTKARRRVKRLAKFRMLELLDIWGDSFAVLWKPGLRKGIKNLKRLLE